MFQVEQYDGPGRKRNPACDSCSEKKIKCDRAEPCRHCTATGILCARSRPNRRRRPKVPLPKQQIIDDNATCHDSTSTTTPVQESTQVGPAEHLHSLPSSGGSDKVALPAKALSSSSTTSRAGSTLIFSDNRLPHDIGETPPPIKPIVVLPREMISLTSQALSLLESTPLREPSRGNTLSDVVLKAAANLARKSGQDSSESQDEMHSPTFSTENQFPSSEVLDSIISWIPKSSGLTYLQRWELVISRPTLESQGLALIEDKVSGPARNHYNVSVNYAAWAILGAKISESGNETMRRQLSSCRPIYERNIISALQQISVADLPTLPLFQALLSGAMFALSVGCLERCWQFTAAASRVFLALGGQSLVHIATETNDAGSSELKHCIVLCYMLEKGLSQTMDRATCLPPMEVQPFTLAPYTLTDPPSCLQNVFLEISNIQDEISRHIRSSASIDARLQATISLQCRMQSFRGKIEEAHEFYRNHVFWATEWQGVDFAYFAVMTSITFLSPFIKQDAAVKQQASVYARKSIQSLTRMLSGISLDSDGRAIKSSIAWKFVFYPLCPFFTIFIDMVENVDLEAYHFLLNTTIKLAKVSWDDHPLGKVVPLLHLFLDLADSMFHNGPYLNTSNHLAELRSAAPPQDLDLVFEYATVATQEQSTTIEKSGRTPPTGSGDFPSHWNDFQSLNPMSIAFSDALELDEQDIFGTLLQ